MVIVKFNYLSLFAELAKERVSDNIISVTENISGNIHFDDT